MSTEFLHVADKHAGYPITVGESVEVLMRARLGDDYLFRYSFQECQDIRQWVWERLLVGFAANKWHAFVEDRETGHWYRIPSDYWKDWFHFVKNGRVVPPEHLQAIGDLESAPNHLIGSPVVVWQEHARTWHGRWSDDEERLAQEKQPVQAAGDPSQGPSQPRTTLPVAELRDEVGELFAKGLNKTQTWKWIHQKYPSVHGLREPCREAWDAFATAAGRAIRPGPQSRR